jgi:hypothetical protein
MAAPSVTARNDSQGSGTSHTIALPATRNVGERILVSFVSLGGAAGPGLSVPEGWNVIGSGGLGGGSGVWHAVIEHVIDGEEDDTIVFTSSTSTVSCHRTWAGPFQEAVIAGPETANANTASYPEVEVEEGDYLVLALCGTQTGAQGMTISTPANYGEALTHNTGNNGVAQGTFERSLLGITSEQPGTSTLGSAERSATFTVAYAAADTGGGAEEAEVTEAAAVGATFTARISGRASFSAGVTATAAQAAKAAAGASITEALSAGDTDTALQAAQAALTASVETDAQYAAIAQAAAAIQAGLEAGETWAAIAAAAAGITERAALGATFASETEAAQEAAFVAGTEAAAQFLGAVAAFALLSAGVSAAAAFGAAASVSGTITAGASLGATFVVVTGDAGELSATASLQAVFAAAAASAGVFGDQADLGEAFESVATALAAITAGVILGATFSASSSADISIIGATASVRAIRGMTASVRVLGRKAAIN